MKKIFVILLFFCSLMLLGQTTYYISPTGNDVTGDGSYSTPWRSLFKATDEVSAAGSIIYVLAGAYPETARSLLKAGVSIRGAGNTSIIYSTVSSVSTILGYSPTDGTDGNQSISYIKIDGNNLTADRPIDVIGRKNVKIHHCEFVNFYSRGVSFAGNNNIPSVYETGNEFHNNIVTNCAKYVPGQQSEGNLRVHAQWGMLIYSNVITQPARTNGAQGFGIKFGNGGFNKGLKIYNNTITITPLNNNYFDFAIELFSSRGGIEIYNNIIQGTVDFSTNATGSWITCNDDGGYGFAIKIYNNIIRQSALQSVEESGIDVERHAYGGIHIFNNYFENLTFAIRTSCISDPSRGGPDHQEDYWISYNIINNIGTTGLGYTYGTGMMIGHWTSGHTFHNINIWNNVIHGGSQVNSANGIRLNFVGSATNISVKNNIIIGFETYSIYVLNSTINGLAINKNIAYGNGNNNIVYSGGSITNNTSTANIISDPLFVGGTPYSFKLKEGSPAINAGDNVGLLYDYAEMAVSSPPEIGAYEYQGVPPLTVPIVTTTAITDITTSTATGGGNVTGDGGAAVTARGVCWSTGTNPTLSNNNAPDIPTVGGTGIFISNLTNLEAGFTYYVRAYATNSVGTAYGNQRNFTASDAPLPPTVDVLVKSGSELVKSNGQLIKIE